MAIVIDIGSRSCKLGFAGDDVPRVEFPSLVGRPRHPHIMPGFGARRIYFGDDAVSRRGVLNLNYPIEYGLINDWRDMEMMWHHAFYQELRMSPEDNLILLTEVPLNPKASRERMTQIMFQTFDFPEICIMPQPVLVLYASEKVTGVVLDSGDTVTHSVPIFEGFMIPHAIERIELGGRNLTDHLSQLMTERGYTFTTNAEREIVEDIKEKFGYIANDFDSEMRRAEFSRDIEKCWENPSGAIISVGNERFRCPEALFQPSLCHLENNGVHEMIYSSIMKCNSGLRTEMYKSIVLAGGSTMFDGFRERLQYELTRLAPEHMEVKVIAPPDRKYSAWIGGSIMASLSSFRDFFITREEYQKFGPLKVHMNCSKTLVLLI